MFLLAIRWKFSAKAQETDEIDCSKVISLIRKKLANVIYPAFGARESASKTIESERAAIFLNEIYIDGVYIGKGCSTLSKLLRRHGPIESLASTRRSEITSTVRSAIEKGANPISACAAAVFAQL